MGFFSVPRLSGWSFQQRIHGGVLPSPSGRISEPEATSPFKKAHRLFEDDENRQVMQRSPLIMSFRVLASLTLPSNTLLLLGNPSASRTSSRVTRGQSVRISLDRPRYAFLLHFPEPSKKYWSIELNQGMRSVCLMPEQ
jgi:hypothetical protein